MNSIAEIIVNNFRLRLKCDAFIEEIRNGLPTMVEQYDDLGNVEFEIVCNEENNYGLDVNIMPLIASRKIATEIRKGLDELHKQLVALDNQLEKQQVSEQSI